MKSKLKHPIKALIVISILAMLAGSVSVVAFAAQTDSASAASGAVDAATTDGTSASSGAVDTDKAEKKNDANADDTTTSSGAVDATKSGKKHHGSGGKDGAFSKSGTHVDVPAVAASVLGKTTEEVRAAVKDSKVGDLLIAAKKVDAFKTAYLSELKTKLDAAVKDGTLTQSEADTKYTEGKAKMDAYDGTTHLCGGTNPHKMREGSDGKRSKMSDKTVTSTTAIEGSAA